MLSRVLRGQAFIEWCIAALCLLACSCGSAVPREGDSAPVARVPGVPIEGWQPVGLSGGGGMFAPAISSVDPDLMAINCDMSGVYLSRDGGRHWGMIHHLQLRSNTRCRPGFHPKDADIIYGAHGWAGELKVSRDGGRHWETIGNLPDGLCGEIAFDPDRPALMLTGTWEGVYLSRDEGRHWRRCEGPSGEALSFFVDRTSPPDRRRLFAATKEGIWRSQDGGNGWRRSTVGLPEGEIRSFCGGSDQQTGLVILYCAAPSREVRGEFLGGVFRSRDLGESWESAMGEGINTETSAADQWAEGETAQYWHVRTTDVDPLVVYTLNASTGFWPPHHATVYRSEDGGEHWRATMFPDPRREPYNVTPNWSTVSMGRSEPHVPYGAAICPTDSDRLLLTTSFAYGTYDAGESWFSAHTLLAPGEEPEPGSAWLCNGLVVTTTWHYYVDPHEPNRHYIAYTDIGLARSLDAGRSWVWWEQDKWAPWRNTCYEIAFDPEVAGKMWGAFSNVHDIPNDNIIMNRHGAEGPGGVCLSTDFGVSWRATSAGLPEAPCTSVVLDRSSREGARTLYAGVFGHGVFKSADDGRTWVKKSRGLGAPENMRVYRVVLHEDRTLFALVTAKRIGESFVGQGAGLYRSGDGTESWECITRSLPVRWPKDVSVHPQSSDIIFIGAADADDERGGLYRTTDGGATWKLVTRKGSQHFGAYFHPERRDWVYLTLCEHARGPSLWLSKDLGDTWRPIESFPFANTQRVQFDPTDPDTLYVTTFGASVLKGPAARSG